jgi:hypothetical protein
MLLVPLRLLPVLFMLHLLRPRQRLVRLWAVLVVRRLSVHLMSCARIVLHGIVIAAMVAFIASSTAAAIRSRVS